MPSVNILLAWWVYHKTRNQTVLDPDYMEDVVSEVMRSAKGHKDIHNTLRDHYPCYATQYCA